MAVDVLPRPIRWPRPKWIGGILGGLLGLWWAFTTITSNVFQATVEEAAVADWYICYSAAECNAGAGSGWSSGSSGNNGTSKTSPMQCPSNMNSKNIQPGDVILVGDGNYTMARCGISGRYLWRWAGKDGTAGNYITVRAENKYGAKLTGAESSTTGPCPTGTGCLVVGSRDDWLIFTENNDYWEFDGFEICCGSRGVNSYQTRPSTHINLKNLKIYNMGFAGIYTGIFDSDWAIDKAEIYDIWMPQARINADDACVHEHAMYWNGYNMSLTNSVIYNDWGGGSVDMGGFCDFDGNYSTDNPGYEFGYKVINNTIVGDGCSDYQTGYIDGAGTRRWGVMMSWNRSFSGYCSQLGRVQRNFVDVTIQNNLILRSQNRTSGHAWVNSSTEGIASPSCRHWPWYSTSCNNSNGNAGYVRVYNNVSADTYVLNPTYQNYVNNWPTGVYSGNVEIAGEQNLTDQANRDYRPTVNSTDLCGQGRLTDMPSDDFEGNTRTQADIGAYAC